MFNQNHMVIALEQLEDDTQAIIETPATPEVTPEELVQSDDVIQGINKESEDIDADISNLVDASVGLENLAETMLGEGYDQAPEDESLTPLELAGVNPALEAMDQEPAKAGESKSSVFSKVKEAGKKALDWLMNMVRNVSQWIVETFQRMAQPLNTYHTRLSNLVNQPLNSKVEIPDALKKRLAGVTGLVSALGDYTKLLETVKSAEPVKTAEEVLEFLKKDGSPDAVHKSFADLRQKYTSVFNQKLDDGWMGTKVYAGGVRFEIKSTPNSFDQRVHRDAQVPFRAAALNASDLSKLANEAKNLTGAIRAAMNKDGAPGVIKNINARVKAVVGSNRELSAEAKALVYVVPKLLKGPGITIATEAASVLGAIVKLVELQAKPAKADKAAK